MRIMPRQSHMMTMISSTGSIMRMSILSMERNVWKRMCNLPQK